jgi:hypothetical protein
MHTDESAVQALLQLVITEINAGRPQQARALCERALSQPHSGAARAALQQMMAVLCMQAGNQPGRAARPSAVAEDRR